MPFRTFGDLPALGLSLEVYCPSCHTMKPVEIDDRLAARRWGRIRFLCSRTHYTGSPCRSRGISTSGRPSAAARPPFRQPPMRLPPYAVVRRCTDAVGDQ
jgi:hypothetical protein